VSLSLFAVRNRLGAPATDALFYHHLMAPKKHDGIFVWRDGESRTSFEQLQAWEPLLSRAKA
jgi:hypothetical protein